MVTETSILKILSDMYRLMSFGMCALEVSRFDHHQYQSGRSDSFQNWVPLHKSLDNNSSSNTILDTFVPCRALRSIHPIFKPSRLSKKISTHIGQETGWVCIVHGWQIQYILEYTGWVGSNWKIVHGYLRQKTCIDF